MASVTDKTISKLFGLAAARCSICKTVVVERDVKIGEMAHIIAKKEAGARGGLPVVGDINGYDNLILLCPNHHAEVDKKEDRYPPEELHRYKNEHEAYVRHLFENQTQKRVMDVSGLRALMLYLPFTQMIALTNGLPERFNHLLFYVYETCGSFAKDNPQCRPFGDANLERYYFNFWQCMRDLVDYEQHATIAKKNVFMPGHLIDANPNISYLNRDLDYQERKQAMHEVELLLNSLAKAYHQLLQHLKTNYPEINLASFVGWH